MPLKRTPPATPSPQSPANFLLSPDDVNVTIRKRGDTSTESLSVDKKLSYILKTMTEIKEEICDFKKAMDFLSQKYDDLTTTVKSLETERNEDRKYIKTLENKVEYLEKNQRSTSIEIRNIPKQANESKDDLLKIVQNIGQVLSTNIDTTNVKDVYRINTKSEHKPIIADFTNTFTKEKIIRNFKTHNKKKENNKLKTVDLKITGPPKNVYVSESLTLNGKRLFYLAREFSKINSYAFCWTSRGKIYIKQHEGSHAIKIDCETDLQNIKA